jgi:hypothetical protein
MHTEFITRNIKKPGATIHSRRLSPFLQLAKGRMQRRTIRIPLAPGHESCLTQRSLLATLREAEYREWLATGGDYLNSTH